MALPTKLFLNAFTGTPDIGSELHPNVGQWLSKTLDQTGHLRPGALANESNWRHKDIGWGLVLPEPEDDTVPNKKRATAFDAPEPIRRLVANRSAPVFRWSSNVSTGLIRRYREDDSVSDLNIALSETGIGRIKIPHYLLMYGAPGKLPWRLQYQLASTHLVGRLDIEDAALDRYVTALIDDWSQSTFNSDSVFIWAVDHGSADITHLMRGAVAFRLNERIKADPSMKSVFLDGHVKNVLAKDLIDGLVQEKPGLIVTSSHGMTAPLNNLAKMGANLGIPVDGLHKQLNIENLLQQWSPDGAVWHAQACCSAGSDGSSGYEGLVTSGSHADQIIKGVANLGSMVSPLPRALLGADKPLRAFIGHVEPTFDWTLRDSQTKQILTSSLLEAMYNRLYQPFPVARAYQKLGEQSAALDSIQKNAIREFRQGHDSLEQALAARLVAHDLRSLVILGDPTAMLS